MAASYGRLYLAGGIPMLTALVTLSMAHAQEPRYRSPGQRDIKLERLTPTEITTFHGLRDGSAEIKLEHDKLLEKAAQWYILRVTLGPIQAKGFPEALEPTLADVVREAKKQFPMKVAQLPETASGDRQRKYMHEFGKEVIKAIEETLWNPAPIARIAAARILAHLGEAGLEEAGDAMVRVVNEDEQIDAVKLYALRGLGQLFLNCGQFQIPKREAECVAATVKFLQRKPNFPKGTKPGEIEAFRYLRREAVRALAAKNTPILIIKKEVVGQPALELLRVLNQDGFFPQVSYGERFDAAMGLCRMPMNQIHADYLAYYLGQFLVDMVNAYNEDRKQMAETGLYAEAWKVQSVQLAHALAQFQKNAKRNDLVDRVVSEGQVVLGKIEKGVETPSTLALQDCLSKTKRESKGLYVE